MPETPATALKVALIADAGEQRERLRELLGRHGLALVFEASLAGLADDGLARAQPEVILIDLVEEPDMLGLEALIESAPAPILFSESRMATGHSWDDKLVHKLVMLARREARQPPAVEPLAAKKAPLPSRPTLKVVGDEPAIAPQRATTLCVLGASIGGPDAVKRFLAALPVEVPVAFLLAQHIGAGFDQRLAEQLNRATALPVRKACHGDRLQHGEVLVVPTGGRLELDGEGRVALTDEAWHGPYNPTINDVLVSAVHGFGERCGAILFSGMGDDGAQGAVQVADAGGYVWAQDEASCVISSIPDAARRRGVVDFSGTPEELARQLLESCARRAASGA
jgi:chemosensory pili system protein ChpB (putative protein-glutamate methylesterase)